MTSFARALRRRLPLITALALATGLLAAPLAASPAGAASAAPSATALANPGSDHRSARAVRALEQARSLVQHPEQRSAGTATAPDRDASMVLRRLAVLRSSLTGADKAAADRLLARPDQAGSSEPGTWEAGVATHRICYTDLCLHWVNTTTDKVNQTDSDGDKVPDYVEQTAAVMEHVHRTYVGAGYRAPRSDGARGGNAKTDVYLSNIGNQGYYGYCTSDQPIPAGGPYNAYAYCVLDNDYSRTEFPTNTPAENLQVTAAHEYFHAVQFGYDVTEDSWFMEATATWAEDELYDAVDDNLQYLRQSPLTQPRIALDRANGDLRVYGAWIFFRFLTERFPQAAGGLPTLVRTMWQKADGAAGAPDQYSTLAIRSVLASRGTSLPVQYAAFADGNRRPGRTYSEGAANHYPVAPLWTSATLTPRALSSGWRSTALNHLASSTARFTPSSAMTAAAWKLRVSVDMAAPTRGSVAVVTVYPKSGTPRAYRLPLSSTGAAAKNVPFSVASVLRVETTLVNASARFRCWRGTAYSCQGTPTDDGLTERVRAVAWR
jgi:hypothetical protein